MATPVQFIKGVGPRRAEALQNAGIETLSDLLYYFPRRHLDRTTVTPLKDLQKEQVVTVVGTVQVAGERKTRRRKLFQAILYDGTGYATLTWFNALPYVKKSIQKGALLAVHGKVDFYNGYQIVHPEYDQLKAGEDPVNSGAIVPIYPLTKELKEVGLDNLGLRRLLRRVLESKPVIKDHFSAAFRERNNLAPLDDALQWIHFAENESQVRRSIYRLKFDEHFFLQLLMALRRKANQQLGAKPLNKVGPAVKKIYDRLDFELTNAQKKVLREIRQDLARPVPMNRLLQGDVGSGKTIVAVLAAAIAVANGVQVAVMAPTEILAHQHYRSFKRYADLVHLSCALLVGNLPVQERRKILAGLEEGRVDIVVGTHALIQKDVTFRELGLVIVDEQHRFGVVQRGDLQDKGYNPHFLAMTATPIPRTLAITYHGDMDLSVIDEMPKDRKPVVTTVVDPDRLPKIYRFMAEEVRRGRQCMVVFPLVEETERSDVAAAVEGHEYLSTQIFPKFSVGLLHGRMKKEEKDAVMDAFAQNDLQILVSTTVIEVGIDVPNATVMLVEHADRFGLTQLHQLRGRVGRGSDKSYCILVQRKPTTEAQKRLVIIEKTTDGFMIATEDLKMRGPGEFYGLRQSGFLKYRIADLVFDGPIIKKARQTAFALVEKDPLLTAEEHRLLRNRFLKDYQPLLKQANVG